jgi:hypothetical protein
MSDALKLQIDATDYGGDADHTNYASTHLNTCDTSTNSSMCFIDSPVSMRDSAKNSDIVVPIMTYVGSSEMLKRIGRIENINGTLQRDIDDIINEMSVMRTVLKSIMACCCIRVYETPRFNVIKCHSAR